MLPGSAGDMSEDNDANDLPRRGDIYELKVVPLQRNPDERGMIFHMLRADDPHFDRFGEIYFMTICRNVIRGRKTRTRSRSSQNERLGAGRPHVGCGG